MRTRGAVIHGVEGSRGYCGAAISACSLPSDRNRDVDRYSSITCHPDDAKAWSRRGDGASAHIAKEGRNLGCRLRAENLFNEVGGVAREGFRANSLITPKLRRWIHRLQDRRGYPIVRAHHLVVVPKLRSRGNTIGNTQEELLDKVSPGFPLCTSRYPLIEGGHVSSVRIHDKVIHAVRQIPFLESHCEWPVTYPRRGDRLELKHIGKHPHVDGLTPTLRHLVNRSVRNVGRIAPMDYADLNMLPGLLDQGDVEEVLSAPAFAPAEDLCSQYC
jgi:hypothetical protein